MSEAQQRYYSQHPVPQHVLGVEFKLVGGLTIKQFAYAGGAVVLAYLLYASFLPLIFRIPLAIFVLILGLSIAFLPVNERSMDEYLKNFLLSISSPTERVWIKEAALLPIFYEVGRAAGVTEAEPIVTKDKKNLRDYLGHLKAEGSRGVLELREEEYLKTLSSEFQLNATEQAPSGGIETPQNVHTYHPERIEVRPTPTLASEVNFTNQDIISMPGAGRIKKFVTTIKNVKAGRKLHTLPTVGGEIVMPVAGETVLKTRDEERLASEELLKKAAAAVSDLTEKMEDIKAKNEESARAEPLEWDRQRTVLVKDGPSKSELAPAAAEPKQPAWFPGEEKLQAATRLAATNEEVENLKKQNEELLLQIGREKKLREEAEIISEESRRYQERIRYLSEQNEKLAAEIKKIEDGYKKAQSEAAMTKLERENIQRSLKEQQRRVEALSKEKAESVDELVRLQKDLQIMRGKSQKDLQEEILGRADKTPTSAPQPAIPRPKPKPVPFVRDLPNVINGYVKGSGGALVKNAVIIVKDQNDDVVRALKTNDLGQFAITTPLPNGLYHVEASSVSLTFDIITVDLIGTVMEPIEFEGR